MDSIEARDRLRSFVVGGNVKPIRDMPDPDRTVAFFAGSKKHKDMTDLDWNFLKVYVEAVMRNGVPFDSTGIHLRDGKFLELDKAKIGAAITAGILDGASPSATVLCFTSSGWEQFIKRL